MGYIEGEARGQILLLPEKLDDYVERDNPVRFIDAYVDSLDLIKLKFGHAQQGEMGRPAYHPQDLIKLYIYGYLHGFRSSRKLECECGRNVELMWLVRKLKPDFKTIADFRKNNGEALAGIFYEFSVFCEQQGLFGKQLVAIDGSKFQGVNSKDRNYSEDKLQRLIKYYGSRIQEFMRQMEEADQQEDAEQQTTGEQVQQAIEALKRKQGEKEQLLEKLRKGGEEQVSLTDPDARRLHAANDGSIVGYNIQAAVDDQHKLIVDFKVTNERTDQHQLLEMSVAAKKALGVENLEVVADKGYYESQQLKGCEEAGITAYVSQIHKPNPKGFFSRDEFIYQPESDTYRCPAGAELVRHGKTMQDGRLMFTYSTTACTDCKLQTQCTSDKGGRKVGRWEHEEVLDRVARRVAEEPEKLRRRKSIVEHPFGTIKRSMNAGYFLTRGFAKVRTEMGLTFLAYNIKRALNILGVPELLKTLGVRAESQSIQEPSFLRPQTA